MPQSKIIISFYITFIKLFIKLSKLYIYHLNHYILILKNITLSLLFTIFYIFILPNNLKIYSNTFN